MNLNKPKYNPLSNKEIMELFKEYWITKDIKIKQEIVCRNMRLGFKLMNIYKPKFGEFEDVMQDVMAALTNAVDHYTPSTKASFSNMAYLYIKRVLTTEIIKDYSGPIYQPYYLIRTRRKNPEDKKVKLYDSFSYISGETIIGDDLKLADTFKAKKENLDSLIQTKKIVEIINNLPSTYNIGKGPTIDFLTTDKTKTEIGKAYGLDHHQVLYYVRKIGKVLVKKGVI